MLVQSLFFYPPSKRVPYPDLQLATAERLGVTSYQGFAYDAGKEASLPGFALSLDAEFGTDLDESAFNALQTAYCAWSETKSRVKYQKGRRYTLLDFLPPLLQAVSGCHFRSSRRKQEGLPSLVGDPDDRVALYTQQEVLLTSNCWGFAWEVLYQADNADTSTMTVSTADPGSAWRALTGPGFDLIQTSRTNPALLTDKQVRNAKLQGGDVLLLWHTIASSNTPNKVYLDHVVTWIDDDVIFEKSGSGDKVPFRLNTWEGLVRNFPPAVLTWEWRRLVRNNRNSPSLWQPYLRLKPAMQVFGVDAQLAALEANNPQTPRFSFLSQLPPSVARTLNLSTEQGPDGRIEAQIFTGILELEELVFDPETGRASLPPSAFSPDYMQLPKLPRNISSSQ